MVELQDSVADLQSSGVEPSVELRYSDQGTEASTITASMTSDQQVTDLPGPSRVVTGPVQTGFDPTTGARRRRSGISSVPTSAILPNVPDTSPVQEDRDRDVVEYETSDDSDDEYDNDISNCSD